MALLAVVVLALPATAAPPAELTIFSRYTVAETGRTTRVVHTISPNATGALSLSFPHGEVQNAKLTADSGQTSLPVTAQTSEIDHLGGKLSQTTFDFTVTKLTILELSYDTDHVFGEFANSSVFVLPAQTNIAIKRVTVDLPTSRGLALSFAGPSNETSIGSGHQIYQFLPSGSGVPQIKLILGSATTAKLKINQKLSNGSWWWKTVSLVLPPDTNQQTVYLENLSPKPSHMGVDRDGNIRVEYRLAPKKSVDISAEALISLKTVNYNTLNTRTVADVPQLLRDYATDAGDANQAVVNLVKTAYDDSVTELAKVATKAERDKLVADLTSKITGQGVPARVIHGVTFVSSGQLSTDSTNSSWVEAFVPGIGWMSVDPLSQQFGQVDWLRLATAITSQVSSPGLPTGDGLKLEYKAENLPLADYSKTSVKLVKYPLLPLVSLARAEVIMPPGNVLDGSVASGPGITKVLGSLVPLQKSRTLSLALGSNATSRGEVQFGRGGSDGIGEVLATGPTSLSWWAVGIEVATLALIILAMIKWRRSGKKTQSVPRLDEAPPEGEIAAEDLLKPPTNDI